MLNLAWKRPGDPEPGPLSRRVKLIRLLLFWLVIVAIGLVIYVVSSHYIDLETSRRLQQLSK